MIGQPKEDFVVLVNSDSKIYQYFPLTILDYPVYSIDGKILGKDVGIVFAEREKYSEKFSEEWDDKLPFKSFTKTGGLNIVSEN